MKGCPQEGPSGRYHAPPIALRQRTIATVSVVGSTQSGKGRHGFQTRNFRPFYAGFFDVSAVPTVSDYGRGVVGLT